MQIKQALVIAIYAGEILLRSGADIARVEETISRITRAYGLQYVETFVTPTGIFVSADTRESPLGATYLKRIRSRTWNLRKISEVNALSRAITQAPLPYDGAMEQLRRIDKGGDLYPPYLKLAGGTIGAAAITMLFGATAGDFLPAVVTAGVVQYALYRLERLLLPTALGDFLGGFIASGMAALLRASGWEFNLGLVITGGVVPLVPGMLFTGMVSDAIAGDLLSAAARGLEALMKSISLATGVALALFVYLTLGGGL